MSRLPNHEYLRRHLLLKLLWQDYRVVFCIASPTQQWDAHQFFETGHQVPLDELIRRRKQITQAWPGLAQRAGVAYRCIETLFRYAHETSDDDTLKFHQTAVNCAHT